MKRILMFQDYYSSGGIEKIINDLKTNLNYKIDILCFNNLTNKNIITLTKNNYRNFFLRNILSLNKFKKYLKNNKYDLIYLNCYNSFGYIYAKICFKYNKNIIIHGHNSNIDKDYLKIKRLINSLIKILFNSNNYIYIAPTIEVANFCFSKNNKVNIIENAINYNKYYFNNTYYLKYKKLFNLDKEIIIGNIGRMEYQKNQLFVLDILNDLLKLNNNYKLIIVGNGSLKSKIIKKINKLKLNDKVILIDKVNNINELINIFDIYLFPSIYEGFPLTLIENQVNNSYCIASTNISKTTKISNKIEYISLDKSSLEFAKIINNLDLQKELVLDNKLDLKIFIENIDKIIDKI